MSYGKAIRQHGISFKGKPVHEFRKGTEESKPRQEKRTPKYDDKTRQRGEIAARLLAGKKDSEIVKELGVAKSSVYVVKVKTGADGKYSSGSPRTKEELEKIVKEAGLVPS